MAKVAYFTIVDKRGAFLSSEYINKVGEKAEWTPFLHEALLLPIKIVEKSRILKGLGVCDLVLIAKKVNGTLVEIRMDYFANRYDNGNIVAVASQEILFEDAIKFLGDTKELPIVKGVF